MKHAFTLSELLVSLSVLGLISALTLPSIFNSVNASKKKAVFKETIQMIQEATTAGLAEGASATYMAPVIDRINVQRHCANVHNNGCVSSGHPLDSGKGMFLLSNGALVEGMSHTSYRSGQASIKVQIDWDGYQSGSNTIGDDIMMLCLCLDSSGSDESCKGYSALGFATGNGSVAPRRNQPSIDLFQEIYS